MIVGVGLDVASVDRVARAIERYGERFWQRILTDVEQQELVQRGDAASFVAGRFAVKEATTKALGGPPDVWWHHIEARPGPAGRPLLELYGPALAHASALAVTKRWVTISHDAGVAAAMVILESSAGNRSCLASKCEASTRTRSTPAVCRVWC
jgi:holo-[acyl-carrier protein] synthase